jgi:SPX domain protein involved in polyphosphate accumulation|tara:strand:+ start:4327 stop:4986 length:660 start_codon:yes stop_codon:yes gene_type:complete
MSNLRIEKKFVFGKYKKDLVEKLLLINNFSKIYPDREISSIYLDTLNFDFARDNINGINERKKIRIRWYNNDLKKIYLEEKNKKNFHVWKNILKMNIPPNKKNLIHNLKSLFFNHYNVGKNINNFNYNFILKTNYKRNYWLSNNGKIRATIDTDINTCPVENMTKIIDLPETILEFKFAPNSEIFFREFLSQKGLNIRSKKYSKYLQSFVALEESGLIN